jgi:hypothetical protein
MAYAFEGPDFLDDALESIRHVAAIEHSAIPHATS